jgi:uncharacterized protein
LAEPKVSRSPLLIGVTELRRRPGTQREVSVTTAVPGLAITTAHVLDDADIELDAVLEAVEGGLTLRGRLVAPWVGPCRRCLEDVTGELDVELQEVFEVRPTPGETYPIAGDDIDLEPVVRDAVLLHLPLAPLCREDCRGPAPDDLPVAVPGEEDEPDAELAPRDPRWAALDVLRTDPDAPT